MTRLPLVNTIWPQIHGKKPATQPNPTLTGLFHHWYCIRDDGAVIANLRVSRDYPAPSYCSVRDLRNQAPERAPLEDPKNGDPRSTSSPSFTVLASNPPPGLSTLATSSTASSWHFRRITRG